VRLVRSQDLIRRFALGAIVSATVVVVDLVTKRIAAVSFADEPLTVIPNVLWFNFVENPGAAFSMLQGAGPFLAVAAAVAVVVLFVSLRTPRPLMEVTAFGMVAGGAFGNLVDRVARADGFLDGRVIDWIQVPNFPLFNIADSAVTVGVALLFIAAWVHRDADEGAEAGVEA
jgi:signal peptidase II